MQTAKDGDNVFLSLIIPAYNEKDRIVSSLAKVRAYLDTLGKPYEIIQKQVEGTDKVKVISYQPNAGKGHAVRQGMLVSRGEYAAFSDTDLSAPIEELAKLFTAIDDGHDIAIGSRAVKGSELIVHQPLYRELGGKLLKQFISVFAVGGIRDTQCGFKLFKGEVARKIFPLCFLNGWGFDVEALYLARRMGYKVAEVPVRWAHDPDSKIHPFRAGLQVLKDIARIRFHRYTV